MTAWLRIALAAQLAFFAAWGVSLLTSHHDAGTVWLATEPVDPRGLLSGHYVALRYRVAADVAGCEAPQGAPRPTTVYVRLETGSETVVTPEGPAAISEAVACQTMRPSGSSRERWIVGQLDAERGTNRIAYGIERFYVTETSALRDTRSGSVVAKVAINDAFEPRLVDLVPVRLPTQ